MKEIKIQVKELRENCMIEVRENGDAIDCILAEDVELLRGNYAQLSMGIAVKTEHDYLTLLVPRSSTFRKFGLIQANSVGLIDNSYCGDEDELLMPVYATRNVTIPAGTRLCQIMALPRYAYAVEKVESLSAVNRGGFGTTGY